MESRMSNDELDNRKERGKEDFFRRTEKFLIRLALLALLAIELARIVIPSLISTTHYIENARKPTAATSMRP
jgi:hypothetical protein